MTKFDCGCEIDKDNFDIHNVNLNCEDTWNLISSGDCVGLFQLDSPLGRHWAKQLKPQNLHHLAALTAILRPGALRAYSGDPPKSMTQHYCDRKNNLEDITYLHNSLKPILETTYGCLIYQEQSMKLAVELAGFTGVESDTYIRKGIGKKKAELIAEIKNKFIDGCINKGLITKEQAEEIFGWIQASNRYQFNACLSPSTIVESQDGYKTLDEVNIGDYISTPEGSTEVVNKYENGVKEVYEIELESGKTIQCTLDHKFLCEDGKIYPLSEILQKNLAIMCGDGV